MGSFKPGEDDGDEYVPVHGRPGMNNAQRNRVGSCPIPGEPRYYSKREADANISRGYLVYQCGMHFHLTANSDQE